MHFHGFRRTFLEVLVVKNLQFEVSGGRFLCVFLSNARHKALSEMYNTATTE